MFCSVLCSSEQTLFGATELVRYLWVHRPVFSNVCCFRICLPSLGTSNRTIGFVSRTFVRFVSQKSDHSRRGLTGLSLNPKVATISWRRHVSSPSLSSVDGLCQGRRRDRRRQATSKPHQPTSLHHAQGSHNKRCHPARCCRADATLHARCSALVGTQSGTYTTRSSNSARTWNAPRQENKRAPEDL